MPATNRSTPPSQGDRTAPVPLPPQLAGSVVVFASTSAGLTTYFVEKNRFSLRKRVVESSSSIPTKSCDYDVITREVSGSSRRGSPPDPPIGSEAIDVPVRQ
ncbi:hypothetical protein CP557_11315 [Natrinema ejinorense]|uniref:Uncharacterized protein n=1 Tax=Natrinema ejinorense TaxID=373386 RepID=A0A2A5QW37_9EURY|nr:hypothetical protein CP557_11315 [Natrinema ejinorense]